MNSTELRDNPENTSAIDFLALLSILLDYKWLIASITSLFAITSIIFSLLASPIYQATALIHIESKKGGIVGLESMTSLTNESPAATEIEILKSRRVIGKAVDNLKLDIDAKPRRLAIIGNAIAGRFVPATEDDIATGPLGLFPSYDWGGATIKVTELELPKKLINKPFLLVSGDNGNYTLMRNGKALLVGETGKRAAGEGITLLVKKLTANPGTQFIITKRKRLNTVLAYQNKLGAVERGKQSGMVGLEFEHNDPNFAKTALNEFANVYVQQNFEQVSFEATHSLTFLNEQLPKIRQDMENAERLLNEFQMSSKSVDISIETASVLDQIVSLETRISDLTLKQSEMDRRYTRSHPAYQALLDQIQSLEIWKQNLEEKVKGLPETQQELLRLSRNVEVSSQIYTQLLQKVQELQIARASNVGNVRIIDIADVNVDRPVFPNPPAIILLASLAGAIIAIIISLLHNLLRRGIQNPADIEALAIPTLASIPLNAQQDKSQNPFLLVSSNPADPTLEAISDLHTTLHFLMAQTPGNIIMLSSPRANSGTSMIAANLACVMAESGKKVLLIDADMRKGVLHQYFGFPPSQGLSNLLTRNNEPHAHITRTPISGLDLMACGPAVSRPAELLLKENFARLIKQCASQYDAVIIDTPPVLDCAEALTVSHIADINLMIVRPTDTRLSEVQAGIKRFANHGISLQGLILNATHPKRFGTNP